MNQQIEDVVGDNKYVELMYKVIDKKTGSVLTAIDFPIGYVHGVNEVLAPAVTAELEGKLAGDVIEVPVDCNELYGPRDESLVIVEPIQNVPKEFHEVGMSILMENDQGRPKPLLSQGWIERPSRLTVIILCVAGKLSSDWRSMKSVMPLRKKKNLAARSSRMSLMLWVLPKYLCNSWAQ